MLTRDKTGALPGQAGEVIDLVADGRPVAFVLLASPLREVETLRIVAQLVKSHHLRAELPSTPSLRPRADEGTS
jgi:hypothetical protein